jgi:membrane-associated phospholipid phosphatase
VTFLAVISALAFVVLALIASRQYVFPLDYTIQDWVQGGRRPALEALMRALTLLGSGWVLLPLAAIGYVLLRRAGHPLGRYVPVAVVGAFLLDGLSKWLVSRPRPRGTEYGFPSGHTLGATIFFGGVIYVLWTSPIPRAWRWAGTAVAALLALGVAYSRLYLRAHWASDVAGGLAGGGAYVLLVLAGVERSLRPAPSDTRRDTA